MVLRGSTATWPAVFSRMRSILRPVDSDSLVATEVSDRVNRVAHDDPACIAEHRHIEQQTLF